MGGREEFILFQLATNSHFRQPYLKLFPYTYIFRLMTHTMNPRNAYNVPLNNSTIHKLAINQSRLFCRGFFSTHVCRSFMYSKFKSSHAWFNTFRRTSSLLTCLKLFILILTWKLIKSCITIDIHAKKYMYTFDERLFLTFLTYYIMMMW